MAKLKYTDNEKNEIINDILSCIEINDNSSLDADRLGEMCAFLISLKHKKSTNEKKSIDLSSIVKFANGRMELKHIKGLMQGDLYYDETQPVGDEVQAFIDGARWALQETNCLIDENK